MAEQSFVSSNHTNNNRTLWYVLSGVVGLAVVLGVGVWWYGNKLLEEQTPTTTPKPVVKQSQAPASEPSAAPVQPNINLVAESKSITFPKAGRVYLYYLFFNSSADMTPFVIDLVTSKANISVETPMGLPKTPNKMHIIDTGLDVVAGEVVAIQPYDFGNFDSPSTGWIKPVSGGMACGSPNHIVQATEIFTWMRSSINATSEPIVSEQCWTDMDPQGTDIDYNDFLLVFTYGKPATPSTSPSATASPSTSVSPSPSPTIKPSASPSTQASATPTPSAVSSPAVTSTPTPTPTSTPTPTPRAAMPDTSEGVPVTGVIEDTIRGIGLGVGLLVLGLLLL